MAVPGFSVSDLIQALGQVKIVYDAFFNEYANSAAQVRELADDIEQFKQNLQKHQQIVQQNGFEYSGYAAAKRTLESCLRFLDEYKGILDKQKRKSVTSAFKTAKFAFEQDEVNRLQAQIASHRSKILLSYLENGIRGSITTPPNSITIPASIPQGSPHLLPRPSVSPPTTPPLLGSPLLAIDGFTPPRMQSYSTPPRRQQSWSRASGASPKNNNVSPNLSQTASRSPNIPRTSQNGLKIPGLVLPQPALPYRVAEVCFENIKIELKRKAAGRDIPGGREMVILDEAGNLRFWHQIKSTRKEACYPYTWHRKWRDVHAAHEIDFVGALPGSHSISFKGAPAINATPKYIFADKTDFEDFQSELRGKHLVDTFEVRQIYCASSSRKGEATDQHIKIWKDHNTHLYSLSYYASAVPKPRHMEFPIAILEQQIDFKGDFEICIPFIGQGQQKRAHTFTKAFSRSPTDRRSSSISTTVSGVFTRNNTGIASSASSMTTVSNSRTSMVGSHSGSSSSQELFKSDDPLGIQAKTMKYLGIEFSDEQETLRFKQMYSALHEEETSKHPDFFLNWSSNVAQQRPDSVISTSPSGTPFAMSPVLHPTQ